MKWLLPIQVAAPAEVMLGLLRRGYLSNRPSRRDIQLDWFWAWSGVDYTEARLVARSDGTFGLDLLDGHSEYPKSYPQRPDRFGVMVQQAMLERLLARQRKDWVESDRIRNVLTQLGRFSTQQEER